MNIRTLDIDELNDRLKELETMRDTLTEAKDLLTEAETDEEKDEAQAQIDSAESDFGADEQAELSELESLKDDVGESRGGISTDGGPFVHENYFEDYARELADDLGAVDKNAGWPMSCIDWGQAAEELKQDYSSLEFRGVTYLYRA
jgi:hypothetical protein